MQYWRMQLHPSDSVQSTKHVIESLSAGFIGLGFKKDLGDLDKLSFSDLSKGEKDYLLFAKDMKKGDKVLIMVHHFPFALITVSGRYNYIKRPVPEIGVWFRHFRRINIQKTKYYADWITDHRKWKQIVMTDTISPLKDRSSNSYQLIESWK